MFFESRLRGALAPPTSYQITWADDGPAWLGVPLLMRTGGKFEASPDQRLARLFMASASNAAGLQVIAKALSDGDTARAMIATLHLQFPPSLDDAAGGGDAKRRKLAAYNPQEPRDWRGRGAVGSVGSPTTAPAPRQIDEGDDEPPEAVPEFGHNGPPSEPDAPAEDPALPRERVNEGWDVPGQVRHGVYYPPTRLPLLRNGQPWPQPTVNMVRAVLQKQPGRAVPYMRLFVPRDLKGPMIIGSDARTDYEQPPGYDKVMLFGTPQETNRNGRRTNHAVDSIEEALSMAESNRFSRIYFNRSFTTVTGRAWQSLIRPDVVGVERPDVDLLPVLQPYETYSPRQIPEERKNEMPLIPRIHDLYGRTYKLSLPRGDILIRCVKE
jgi:hypothetical protein